jgi:hypothetical protein
MLFHTAREFIMPKLTITQRKWLLILHLIFIAIWFGNTVIFLILSIAASLTTDENVVLSSYTIMHLLAQTSGRASIIGSVVTGILLSLFTKWGLFKFKWIIAKEILTLLSVGIGIVGIYYWTLHAFTMVSLEGIAAFQNQSFIINNYQLFGGIILQILSLAAMIVISVFKPWGRRKNGQLTRA